MGKSLKYVKEFDFSAKPCNYSTGGEAKSSCYKKGGKVAPAKAKAASRPKVEKSAKVESVQTPTMRRDEMQRSQTVVNPRLGGMGVPVASQSPLIAPPAMKTGGKVAQKKMGKVMGEFKSGELHSGSKKGPVVKSRKQAVAIAMSEARKAGKKA